MIQWMHALSKHWLATLLLGGLSLAFVVWGSGMAELFTGVANSAVASVGGTDISGPDFQRSYKNFLRNQGRQMGMELTPEMAQKMGLGQMALQQMVGATALDNEAERLGLTTSDTAVAQNVRAMSPFRGALGTFDRPTFMQAINTAGYTEDQFLNEVRHEMTRDQLTQAVEANFVVPLTYAQALFQYIAEKRAADYVVLTQEQAGALPTPSDTTLNSYLKAHAEKYSTPEYRDADYAAISEADVMGQVTVTDAQIQQQYDAHKATYVVPEKRDVQQIEFKTEKEATDARADIAKGTSFEAQAARRGLKPEQTSLGTLTQAELPDADRAKAVFALPVNEVSQPLKSAFGGWALVRVTKITQGSNKTLADVKEDIRKDLAKQLADNKLVDVVNAFTDAKSSGANLKEAAQKSGMKLSHLSATDAEGKKPDGTASDAPADPEFLPGLFKAEVGEDSEPFATKAGSYFAVHVNGETPRKPKPLDQVRAQVLADWTAEQRAGLLANKARELSARAAKEKSLDGIAKDLKLTVQHSPALGRDTNTDQFNAELIQKIFAAPAGGVDFGPGASGSFVIAKVTGINHPAQNPSDPGFRVGSQRLSQAMAQDFSINLANAARTRQGVKVNQKLLSQITEGNQ
jgi:peptidyl-prolyl cis-trans isomerase D